MTVVNVNPEARSHLVKFLSDVLGQEFPSSLDLRTFVELMSQHTDALIESEKVADSDAEGCFQILFFELQEEKDTAVMLPLVGLITSALTGSESKAKLRLKILANLYNALCSDDKVPEGQIRVDVLLAIIKYAGKTQQSAMLHGYFDLLDELMVKWNLSLSDKRTLFVEVSKALEAEELNDKAHQFLIRYLATFDDTSDAVDTSKAAQGAIGAIRKPILCFMERHNLLGMTAMQQLENDAEYGKLYELLRIFSVGKLREYLNFYEAEKGTMERYGLEHEECIANMRLLSLCSLATEHEEIPYAAIAETLEVPLEEVEYWVVATTTAKLMDAKMDQLQQVVMISRCTHRVFEHSQWKQLAERLTTWKINVRNILETIQRTQVIQAQSVP
uniref:Eukaryotic translation initiation factor 3 subunit M n=1 Tax=Octactis speculum TaxID=3111310 RepID=A0A7S2CTT4_9STRA|mmetsp:Transcript_39600/g.53822  ORF Transcript_39600/g.53822 Transcript_39600/m.53822 type:complete len:388 (+) Transcript_39600:35-1198(+)|eukprot:CAMPEP_0185745070 /NCGR_PEP_ID=MMETSP1174-20130828/3366_1 /TAXON_ID=35687 /ORGANISM="Dictyocha speculum, Strain CCMP1381" /LENGTH=387 /DNA_ID=CAMNT_0028418865 /DNA_START=35 /DNA_END=1198 /DNA_ORIENTATION=-